MTRNSCIAAAIWVSLCGAAPAAPAADLWLDVPFVRQTREACGEASIAMVMQYWQRAQRRPAQAASDEAEILRALPPGRHGLSNTKMAAYFERHGYRVFTYAGDWDNAEQEIAKGRPLIAALKPEGGRALHYVVIAGVDDPEQAIMVNDPAQRKLLKEARAQFEREWKDTGNWTLLAVPEPR